MCCHHDTVAPTIALTTVTNPINAANATSTTASGTGEEGASISLVASDGTHTTSAHTTTVAADGTWSISGIDVSALNDGTITYTATASDAAGNTAPSSLTAIKDTVAPAVAVTSVTNPITIANATHATASGTGEVGAAISVVASDGTNTCRPNHHGSRRWDLVDQRHRRQAAINDGTITYTATASDAAGNTAKSSMTATKAADGDLGDEPR